MNPNDPNNAMLSEALSLKVPGVDAPPAVAGQSGMVGQAMRLVQPGAPVNDNSARTLLAISMVAAIGGSTDALHQGQAAAVQQRPEADRQIRGGGCGYARSRVGVQSVTQLKVLADCREKQVADFKSQLAAASDKDKKLLVKAQAQLGSAVVADS